MATKPDYYDLLGVQRESPADEIKKAYRKKAFELHPDRNPGDHAAEEQFKLVSEAYEVLSDDRQRQIYDRYGHAGLKGGAGGFHEFHNTEDVFSAFSDIFEDFFGFDTGRGRRGAGTNRPRRGRDLQTEVQVEFLEACFGVEREVGVASEVACETCDGSGAKKGSIAEKCTYCNGYGQVQMSQGFFTISTTCPQCSGAGQMIKDKCPDCRGQGRVAKERKLKVKIPAGISDEMRLVMRGEGESGQHGGPAGDLYVFVRVAGHPEFSREEDNVVSRLELPFPLLALGTSVEINTIDGVRSIDLKPGTQSGDVICLERAGIPSLRGGRRGDHLVHIQAVTPKKLSARQKELLEELAKEFAPSAAEGKETKDGKSKKKKKGLFSSFLEFGWAC
jgi:molecular chaperone DnaJ